MNKHFFWLILALLLFGAVEITSLSALFVLSHFKNKPYAPTDINNLTKTQRQALEKILHNKNKYIQYDSLLGWTIQPNGQFDLYKANSQGLRADREFPLKPNDHQVRILTFGDSFTHGDDTDNQGTWQSQLEDIDQKLEVLNFGVGGYGIDQAFLLYQHKSEKHNGDIVFIGLAPINTFRSVNTFRPFNNLKSSIPLSKPRFIIKNQRLSVLKNPLTELTDYQDFLDNEKTFLKKLGKHDYFYQKNYHKGFWDFLATSRLFKILKHDYQSRFADKKAIVRNQVYNPYSEAFTITALILDQFYSKAEKKNTTPYILIFPSDLDILHKIKHHKTTYQYYLEFFKDRGMKYIDLMEVFLKNDLHRPLDDYFGPTAHYSELANQLIAQHIYERLKKDHMLKE